MVALVLVKNDCDVGIALLHALGDHPKAAIDDQVKSGHREKA
jgi:hypothetical protein